MSDAVAAGRGDRAQHHIDPHKSVVR